MHVRVNDVNEFAPVFVERLYRAAVTEGKLYDRILRVEAIDGDCSPQYSQICYYEILTPNTPFLIDNDGESSPAHPSCPALVCPHSLGHPGDEFFPLFPPFRSSFHILLPRCGAFFLRCLLPSFLLPNSPATHLAHESSLCLPRLSLVLLSLSVLPSPSPRKHREHRKAAVQRREALQVYGDCL